VIAGRYADMLSAYLRQDVGTPLEPRRFCLPAFSVLFAFYGASDHGMDISLSFVATSALGFFLQMLNLCQVVLTATRLNEQ